MERTLQDDSQPVISLDFPSLCPVTLLSPEETNTSISALYPSLSSLLLKIEAEKKVLKEMEDKLELFLKHTSDITHRPIISLADLDGEFSEDTASSSFPRTESEERFSVLFKEQLNMLMGCSVIKQVYSDNDLSMYIPDFNGDDPRQMTENTEQMSDDFADDLSEENNIPSDDFLQVVNLSSNISTVD